MEARPGEAYRRILLDLLVPIGDTLFATPAVRALRRAQPAAHLTALVSGANRAVLENDPDVDALLELGALRRGAFDLAVHFAPYHDALDVALGIPRSLRLPCPWLYWLLPHANRRWRHLHARDHYLEVLRPLGLHRPADRRLVLTVSDRQQAFAGRFLRERGHQPGELLVGLHAGAAGFRGAKRWSADGFAYVARQLGHARLVFFGGRADRELARAVVEAGVPDGFIDTSGQVSLSQAIGILSQLDLFVGNDSGPLHLAAALGVPAVGVYGPTSVLTYHPIGPMVRAVYGSVPCPAQYGFIGNRPLWQRRACRGECLDSLDPQQVADAAQELLAERRCLPDRSEGSVPAGMRTESSPRSG
ncbi:MAG TPA: glycosyltransferase family 9 protein [Chloroflexota bacterium]|nr:glycosyltransferase family 9 protein [Chloroflexota bacterium]